MNLKQGILGLKRKISNKIKNGAEKFQKNFSAAKSKPRSKRRSLFLGFATVVSIFGVTLLAPVLPAVAKDLPNKGPKPSEICPAPTPEPALLPSERIVGGLAGAAGSVCALAISSGSFIVGAACGFIIVVGILKAQGK